METAKLRMPGCGIYLPFESAYDQEVVFDHLQRVARAPYRAALEVHERCLLVSECGTQACGCADCGRTIACGSVQHRADDHTLCTGCARRMVHTLDRNVVGATGLQVVTGAARPLPAP
jgi:hypothetical protein